MAKDYIDQLRTEAEYNHRFKKALNGYDRESVDTYIEELIKNHDASILELQKDNKNQMEELQKKCKQRLEQTQEEKKQLQDRIKELETEKLNMNNDMEELKDKIKNREVAERMFEDSMVDQLKSTNEALKEENSKKQMTITELEDKLSTMQESVQNHTELLKVLDKKLGKMLQEKLNECTDIISAWESQFERTSNEMKEIIGV